MSCYTRHLDELLPAGPRPEARRRLDAAVRSVVGMPDSDCPEVWAAVKQRLGDPQFASQVIAAAAVDGRDPSASRFRSADASPAYAPRPVVEEAN